jgi:hypothetical protein
MPIGLVMTFDGVTQDMYDAAMASDALDLTAPKNPSASDDNWPDGALAHYAGATPTGWCVVDVWESQAHFDKFLADRLGPTLQKVGIPQPDVRPFEVYNSHT